jgi:ribulose-bisphosphate carboxylase small chain
MRITQGTFSFLPDLTDEQIRSQVQYSLEHEWAISIEHTDEPHPRNSYWEMHGQPLFDVKDATVVMRELSAAREQYVGEYIRLSAFDPSYCRQTTALSFIVQRPAQEPRLRLDRDEGPGRTERFSLHITD